MSSMIRRSSKRNASKKGQTEPHNDLDGIAQILEESMGHLSTNFDKDKVRKSYSLPTNSFGEIEFTGLNQSGKFAKLPYNSQESALQTALQTKWELNPPTLVISIFGGDFEKKRKLKMIFKKGLWKAAESAGCWIVTEGFNIGIMKLAGEAVRDYTDAYGGNKMIAIGISPWNTLAKKDVLENSISQGNPAKYQAEEETTGNEESECKVNIPTKDKSLDPNHSYFFLFDENISPVSASAHTPESDDASPLKLENICPTSTSTTKKFEFRTRFEHAVSSWKNLSGQSDDGSNELRVPICGLVVGGNLAVLKQVFHSIIENKCPIVVCQGTSGAADALALGLDTAQKFALDEAALEDIDLVPLDIRLESVLRECLHKTNPEIDDYKADAIALKEVVTDLSYLISVFDMEEDWDLDGYIISSLLSSAGTELGPNQLNLEQLEITLTLNRADIAKEKIFLENKRWKKGDLNDYMFNALMSDRHDFVKLFLEQGFSLEEFLTVFTLEKLYSEQLKNMNSRVAIFYQLWDHHKTHRIHQTILDEEVYLIL